MRIICQVCGQQAAEKINTRKHLWFYCLHCSSAWSKKKATWVLKNYPIEYFTRVFKGNSLNNAKNLQDEKIYNYMASEDHIAAHEKRKVYERFVNKILKPLGINVNDKTILDISGGNGSFGHQLELEGARVVITEFNRSTVEFARQRYGLEALTYDFNSDDISTIFAGRKFDIILLRAAIMFCVDIKKLIAELRGITNENALIIVESSVNPNTRSIIEWQNDEYNLLRLYSPRFLEETFLKEGLKVVYSKERPLEEAMFISNYRSESFQKFSLHYKLHLLFWKYFYLITIYLLKRIPRSNKEEAHDFVLKFDK